VLGVAAGIVVCCALAGRAGSAFTPPTVMIVSHEPIPGKTVETLLLVLPTQGETLSAASVSVYVPAGYTLNLSYPPGTKIGSLFAPGSSTLADLTVTDPATITTDPCAPGTHAAVWTASLTVSGQPVAFRIFVDATTGDEAARGAYRLTYCQTIAPLFVLEGVVTTPTAPGLYTWRAFVTPPGANGAPPDPNTVYEVRSIQPLPNIVKAKATYVPRTQTLVISGKVTAGTGPEAHAMVEVERLKGTHLSKIGTGTTSSNGTFVLKKRIRQTKSAQTLNLDVGAGLPLGPCTDPPLAPAGCLSQSTAPAEESFTAKIPKLPPKKPKKR
jgi:hypothetical protein